MGLSGTHVDSGHFSSKNSRTAPKFSFPRTTAPGIDLAILIALGSAIIDVLSLFQPWLVGLNDEYVTGKGLTYAVGAEASGIQLIQTQPYLAVLLIPMILTGFSFILAISPDDVTARVSYRVKSGLLLIPSIALSIFPSYMFMNNLGMGIDMTRGLNVFVSLWELGSGATLSTYAGLGFAAALLLRIFKD
jgi:hypothetical protein